MGAAGSVSTYAHKSPDCEYTGWTVRGGADEGTYKTLWQWLGGDLGYNCDFSSESDMDSYAVNEVVLSIKVCCHCTSQPVAALSLGSSCPSWSSRASSLGLSVQTQSLPEATTKRGAWKSTQLQPTATPKHTSELCFDFLAVAVCHVLRL